MDTALLQDSQEQTIHQNYESDTVERLFRVLMITKGRTVPLQSAVIPLSSLSLKNPKQHFNFNLLIF
jgi:hypothetical protein